MKRIKKDDMVKIIAGSQKGKVAKVARVDGQKVYLENVSVRTRHIAANRLNKQGGKKDIQLPIDISNVAIVHGEKETVSKIAYKMFDDKKIRIAKKTGKEIK
ncbi:MAG: 50S ribosomal protein L24 [Candidatus Nomurabacteria bacterium]|jgi:large subunit ribosomal protein L24|nr:50S ribosomal protein L24 [Candidatus Nomurabacteria bacterium]